MEFRGKNQGSFWDSFLYIVTTCKHKHIQKIQQWVCDQSTSKSSNSSRYGIFVCWPLHILSIRWYLAPEWRCRLRPRWKRILGPRKHRVTRKMLKWLFLFPNCWWDLPISGWYIYTIYSRIIQYIIYTHTLDRRSIMEAEEWGPS